MKNTRSVIPSSDHLALRNDLIEALQKYKHLPAEEILAVVSHLVGQVIALQDQRTMTRQRATMILIANIEGGNAEAIHNLSGGMPAGNA